MFAKTAYVVVMVTLIDRRQSVGLDLDVLGAGHYTALRTQMRGRGARNNISGRYEKHSRALFDDGWDTLEDVPPLKTEVFTETPKTILTRNESPDISFDRTRDASLLRTGDVITPQTIARARDKVAAMGVFSTVDVTPEFDDASGTASVLIKVTEAPFQTFEAGVGIEADQLRQLGRAGVKYTNKNIGRGQQKVIVGGSIGYASVQVGARESR